MTVRVACLLVAVALTACGTDVPGGAGEDPRGGASGAPAASGPDDGPAAEGTTCPPVPAPGAAHAGSSTATFDEPGQDPASALYRQFVYDATKPADVQLPVRTAERSYVVYQLRASRQDLAHENVTGLEYGSHVGMGIVRRQIRMDDAARARAAAPHDASTTLRWPDETSPAERLVELTSGACEPDPDTRVLYMNNHGSALRYRYFDWDRSRLGTPVEGGVAWGGPLADRSACPGGACVAYALYKAQARASAHPDVVDDTLADSSRVVAEVFVPLAHDPATTDEPARTRAQAELARVAFLDRCLSFRPLRDDRETYRRGAGVSGFCDAQCGHDGYTLPGGLASSSTGWVHRGFGESVRRLRSFSAEDVAGDTLGYGTVLANGSVGYYYAGRRLLSSFGFTFENTDEAWHASYPAAGHNSNTDAEAQRAMFRFCADAAELGGVEAGESLERATRWTTWSAGEDDATAGTMAAAISATTGSGLATVCEEVCRGGAAGRPTRESGFRNAAPIWTAESNATFASTAWPPEALSNVIWSGDDLQALWDTRRLYVYKKRVGGFTSGPFHLDNGQAADVPRNPLAGHHAYRALVHAFDPTTTDESGTFRYRARATPWPASEANVGPLDLHPMAERTHYDEVVQSVVLGGAAVSPASRWVSNDADLTGSAPAHATNGSLTSDGDVASCQLYVGRALPVGAGTRCKLVRGM